MLGVDEAGRGPLAGPITVAVVSIRRVRKTKRLFKGIRDSKKFSEKQREEWFTKFKKLKKEGVLEYAAAFSGAKTIDTYGIVGATKRALARVIKKIIVEPEESEILLDGTLYAPKKYRDQKTIIRGDDTIPIIAAASIVAKVLRDRKMKRLSKKFPGYGFEIHKGYGTEAHYKALRKHGFSPLHRRNFCKKLLK